MGICFILKDTPATKLLGSPESDFHRNALMYEIWTLTSLVWDDLMLALPDSTWQDHFSTEPCKS